MRHSSDAEISQEVSLMVWDDIKAPSMSVLKVAQPCLHPSHTQPLAQPVFAHPQVLTQYTGKRRSGLFQNAG